jgi:DNA replication protein DnaC
MRREQDAARPPRSNPRAARPYVPPAYPLAVPADDRLGPFASAALPSTRRPAGPSLHGSPTPVQLAQEPPAPPARRPPATPPAAHPAPLPAASASPSTERVLRRVDGSPIQPRRARPATRQKAPARPATEMAPMPAPPAPPVDLAAHEIILELPPRPAPVAPVSSAPQHPSGNTRRPVRSRPALPAERMVQPADERAALPVDITPLPPGACPICHGAGYLRHNVPVGHPLFGRAVPCRCKEEEMERRRRDDLWRLSSLDAFQEMTFTTFNPKITGTREAWDVARRYAEDPDGWLVLSGPCGSGKTHLAAAIANHQFAQGNLVLFAVVPQLLDHLRAAFAPSSETTYDALFTKVCEAGLLVLDDLGAEHTTPWAQEKLFQIINHRYMYGLSTVITTNLELINDLDDRVRSRLTDISLVRHVRLAAADFRPRHAPPRRKAGE